MRVTNLLATLVAVILFACGQNSTKNTGYNDSIPDSMGGGLNKMNSSPDNSYVNVPEATRRAFQEKYPQATNVNWKRYEPYEGFDWSLAGWPSLDTEAYSVTYTDNGTEYNAWYDKNNNWVGTVYHLRDKKGIPQSVIDALNKEYSGYTVTEVTQENDKNRTAYEVKMEKGTDKVKLLIDDKGTIINRSVKKEDEMKPGKDQQPSPYPG